MANKLSQSDVAKLLSDPSAENRAGTARKLGEQFSAGGLGPEERKLAQAIFSIMVKDAEVHVRKVLSESLKGSAEIPREVALSLAGDVADVALPIIEFSDVLTDDDLLQIIATSGAEHQQAVARREIVSEKLVEALVETGDESVVATLVANDGAALTEETMSRVLEEFGDNKRVSEPMAQRRQLPLVVAERLVHLVSEKIRDHLLTHHEMSADVATDLFLNTREKATVGLLQPDSKLRDVVQLVDQLHCNGRLTPSLILRALCMGDTTFFEAALARRADIPVANAYKLIHDPARRGLAALFDKCGLSAKMLEVCVAALEVADEMRYTGGDDRERFRQIMIERVITRFEDSFDPDNLDYFIAKLGGRAVRAA